MKQNQVQQATLSSINMMKLKAVSFLLGAIMIASCAALEPTEERPAETEPEAEVPTKPEWFDDSITADVDTAAFYGYAVAISADSAEAVEQSVELAEQNLRFAVDEYAESVRQDLSEEDGNGKYSSPAFILELRNSVMEMDISGASVTNEHFKNHEGTVHRIYSKAELPRDVVHELLGNRLNDEEFTEHFARL